MGAYCSNAGPLINTVAAPRTMATNVYKVPAIHGHHRLVLTNTTPTAPYRGAGRPNVAYLWERLVDEAARVDRHRPRRAAPPQPDRRRTRSPTRRRPARSTTAAIPPACSTRRCSLGLGRLRARRAEAQGARASCAASGCATVHRAVGLGRRGGDRDHVPRRRHAGALLARRAFGAGLRDRLSRDRRQGARARRRQARPAQLRSGRPRADRHRLVRLALADQPRRGAAARARSRSSRRAASSRPGSSRCPPPISTSRAAATS